MQFHPVAEIFPMMTEDELDLLCQDISGNSQREPILLALDGGAWKIADGRNRYRACVKAGIEPRYREWDGVGDLTAIVISLNLKRRHLSPSQLAMVAARLATMGPGRPQLNTENSAIISQGNAAKLLNVSTDSIQFAKKVQRDGVPELNEIVDAGEMKVSTASEVSTLSPAEQRRIVDQVKKIKKTGRRSQKRVLLGLKTQSLRQTAKGYGTCLNCNPEAEWTDVSVSAFAQRLEHRAKEAVRNGKAAVSFATYFEGIAFDIEEEKRAAAAREGFDKIFAVIDAGATVDNMDRQCAEKTDIQRLTKIPWDQFNDLIANMLDLNMIEVVKQGGKTEGARGARKLLFRRTEKPLGDLEYEIDDDFPEEDVYLDRWED